MEISEEAKKCWFHSCAGHYCLEESWVQNCTYPDCKVKDYATGEPYYKEHKKPEERLYNEYEEEDYCDLKYEGIIDGLPTYSYKKKARLDNIIMNITVTKCGEVKFS